MGAVLSFSFLISPSHSIFDSSLISPYFCLSSFSFSLFFLSSDSPIFSLLHTKWNLILCFPSFLDYFSLETQNSNPCSECSFSLWYFSVPNSSPNLIGWDSLWLQSGSTWLDWRLARGYNHSLLWCYKRPKHTHIRPLKTSCHTIHTNNSIRSTTQQNLD